MPSLVPGNSSWTAWAVTCPVEWRRMSRPASESMVIGAIESPALSSRLRSAGSPLSHIAMTVRSEEKISVPVSPSFQGMLSPAQSMLSATDLLHSSAVRTSRPQDSSTNSVVPNQLGGSHATATHAEFCPFCEPAWDMRRWHRLRQARRPGWGFSLLGELEVLAVSEVLGQRQLDVHPIELVRRNPEGEFVGRLATGGHRIGEGERALVLRSVEDVVVVLAAAISGFHIRQSHLDIGTRAVLDRHRDDGDVT